MKILLPVILIPLLFLCMNVIMKDEKPDIKTSSNKSTANNVNVTIPQSKPTLSEKDLKLQQERLAFINELKKENVVHKIEKLAKYPHVYVAPVFYTLNFEQKSQLSNIIFTYYITDDPKADILLLYDYYNGKEIGSFTKAGLKLK